MILSLALISSVSIHAEASQAAGPSYFIAAETYEIAGRTKPDALIAVLGDATGKTFASRGELETFVRARAQKMENLRTFKKSELAMTFPEGDAGQEGAAADRTKPIPVILQVRIQDGTVFFPIPYLFYNSNDGFQAGVLLTVPNVAGSLENLMAAGFYSASPDERDKLQWTDPNYIFLLNWSGLRIAPFKADLTGMALKMNQRIENRGEPVIKMDSINLSGSVKVTYPFTDIASDSVSVKLSGSPQNRIEYCTDPEFLEYGPVDTAWKFENAVTLNDIDWIGNFRKGYRVNLAGSYSLINPRYAARRGDALAEVEITRYIAAGERVNPNFRIYSFMNSGLPLLTPASYIRGIRNTELKGNFGFFVNTGLQIKLIRFRTAEIHLIPGIDYAFVSAFSDPDYRSESGFGVGSDLILIFDGMKAFPIKLGAAYDLRPKYGSDTARRIEVDFKFSFSY